MKKIIFPLLSVLFLLNSCKSLKPVNTPKETETSVSEERIMVEERIEAIEEEEEDEEKAVIFRFVEQKPMFEACKELPSEAERISCFKSHLDKHVMENLIYPEKAYKEGIQERVSVIFTIDKSGIVSEIQTIGEDPLLKAEAKRIFEALPKLIPGKQRGKPVAVSYFYPVIFKINQ